MLNSAKIVVCLFVAFDTTISANSKSPKYSGSTLAPSPYIKDASARLADAAVLLLGLITLVVSGLAYYLPD